MPVEITNSGNPSVQIDISRTGGGGAPYDDTELRERIETLEEDVDTIEENVPFKFGIDANGNYGYYKEGADSVTPFKTGGGGVQEFEFEFNTPSGYGTTADFECIIPEGTVISYYVTNTSNNTSRYTCYGVVFLNGEYRIMSNASGSYYAAHNGYDIFQNGTPSYGTVTTQRPIYVHDGRLYCINANNSSSNVALTPSSTYKLVVILTT